VQLAKSDVTSVDDELFLLLYQPLPATASSQHAWTQFMDLVPRAYHKRFFRLFIMQLVFCAPNCAKET